KYSTIIEKGFENGWLAGNPDDTFHPEEKVSASLSVKGIPNIVMADVKKKSWYAGYIYHLAALGIISGSGNTYRPEENLTRGEFAKMLCNLKGWKAVTGELPETTSAATSGHWAYPYMAILQEKGVVAAGSLETLGVDRSITRAETAKMAVLAAGYKTDTTQDLNPDIIGHWAEQFILTAKKHQVITGYPDGLFKPDAEITRAEACKIIWKMRN
ncbi:MAG: S-layer homology domain-containing protein, partial [Rubrobacteridae bacterium]|nr:S-layer homology domain-containing protein [Rubrobacteridae bacterium]